MLHHVSLPVTDLAASRRLYSAALGALGYRLVAEAPGFAGYGIEDGKDRFALKETATPVVPASGFHLAFAAPTRAAVVAFHAAAVAHGADSVGAAGERPHYGPNYFAAFVIDPDGHRIEAVINTP